MMWRKIIAILLAGGGSAGAASVALSELFGAGGDPAAAASGGGLFGPDGAINWETLTAASEKVGASGLGAILLPIVFFFLRGVQSYVISVAVLTAAAIAGVLYFGLAPNMPLVELATVTGIGSAVAVAVYRIIT